MEEMVKVASSESLKPGLGLLVRVGEQRLAVFREADKIYCVDDMCPHAGASLAQGTVCQGVIYCPWHQWGFQGKDGKCVTGSIWHVDSYRVVEKDGAVWVSISPSDDK